MKLICVFALFIIAGAGAVQKDDSARIFCGRYLARARALYCYGLTENQRKRSAVKTSLSLELLTPEKMDKPGYQVRNDDQGGIFEDETQSTKGVKLIDECCNSPCLVSELLNYC